MATNFLAGEPTIGDAIREINADAKFKYEDEDVNTIEWLDGTAAISASDITAKVAELKSTWDTKSYARERRKTFRPPGYGPQLDMLWHDIDDGKFGDDAKTGSFYTYIKGIKDANPKS